MSRESVRLPKMDFFRILYYCAHFSLKHCCEIIVLKEPLLVEFEGVAIHYWNFSLGEIVIVKKPEAHKRKTIRGWIKC